MYWKTWSILLVLLVVGGIGSTVYAQEAPPEATQETAPEATPSSRTVDERLQDASLAARVLMALADDRSLKTYTFEPVAERGVVTLFGQVDTRAQYDHAVRIVQRVQGVEDLVNELTVTSSTARISSPKDEGDAAVSSGALYHTVREGESLWLIARRYGTSISAIQRLSNLTSNTVQPGQRVRVR